MGASGRSPLLWRESSASSLSTTTRAKRQKAAFSPSTPNSHSLVDDDQKDGAEGRVNGLNDQLTTMQKMINSTLKNQKKFQDEIQITSDTVLQFNDLRQVLEVKNLNLQDGLDEARNKMRDVLDKHREEKIALEDKYREHFEAKSRELREELEDVKAKSRELANFQQREKSFIKQELLIEWKAKYSKLEISLEEARNQIIQQSNRSSQNKETTEHAHESEWGTEGLQLRDDLDEARKKFIELAESQLRDKDFQQECLIEYESKTSQLRDELEQARVRITELIEEQLGNERVIEERYRTEWTSQNTRLRDELEEARKRIFDLSNSQLETEREVLKEKSRAEWQAESRGLRDDLNNVTQKLREISENQTQDVTVLEDRYRTETSERAMKLESELDTERRKNLKLLDAQLEERKSLYEKYQQDIEETRKVIESLFNGQVKIHEERQEEWKTKVSELQSQLKETEKLLQDVSDSYHNERHSHKEDMMKLDGELTAVKGHRDLDLKELGFRSEENIRNLETQLNREVEEIRRSLETEIERLTKKSEKEKLAEVRKVQEDYEARLQEMRTTLETEISRLQWRNEKEKSTLVETIRRQHLIKMRQIRRTLTNKFSRLRQTNNRKHLQELEAASETRKDLENEITILKQANAIEKMSHAQKIVEFEGKAEILRLKLESEATSLQKINNTKDEQLSEIRQSRDKSAEEAKNIQSNLEAESMVLKQANEAEKVRVQQIQTEFHAKTEKLEKALEAEGEKLRDLMVQYKDVKQEIAAQELTVTELEHNKQTLELALDQSRREFESTKDKAASNDEENAKLQADLKDLRSKLDSTSTQQGHSMAEMTQAVKEKDSELAKLREGQQELSALRAKFEMVEGQLNDHINTEKTLSAEIKDLHQKLEEAKGQSGASTEKEIEISKTLAIRDTEVNNLQREVEKLQGQESAYRDALEEEKRRATQLEDGLQLQLDKVQADANRSIEELMQKLRNEETGRRKLFHDFQTLRGTIRVMCRIRPSAAHEDNLIEYKAESGDFHRHPIKLTVSDKGRNHMGELRSTDFSYEFERLFLPSDTNNEVFEEISDFVQSFIDGRKACIFCYGQSGTGKTYTMSNLEDVEGGREEGQIYKNDGIIPRMKTKLFAEKRRLEDLGGQMEIRSCCYEIYDKQLCLLRNGRSEPMRFSPAVKGVLDPKLAVLSSPDEFDAMVQTAMRSRHFGSTALNDNSSRSHFIISLETSIVTEDGVEQEGLLNLVDLAGSERQKDSQTSLNADSVASKEGTDINTSLAALSSIFVTLAASQRPNFRGNALTQLLEPSLQQGCMTLMFVMISPLVDHWGSSKHSLGMATTAQNAKKGERRDPAPSSRAQSINDSGRGRGRGQSTTERGPSNRSSVSGSNPQTPSRGRSPNRRYRG